MAGVCGDDRFEVIAKVKEHLIKSTNIEMQSEELAQVDNILFRLWQLNYFNQCNLVNCSGRENAINYRKAQIQIKELEKENAILKKALNLYVNWADECGIAWDNFPDMAEKWYKVVEEKGLGWIDGLVFMVTEEAKEQLMKEQKLND